MTEVHFAVAEPWTFGAWVIVASQINGPVTYSIQATAMGNTRVFGEVRYWDEAGELRVEPFYELIQITTGNSTQNVRVRFKSAALVRSEVRIVVTSWASSGAGPHRAPQRTGGSQAPVSSLPAEPPIIRNAIERRRRRGR